MLKNKHKKDNDELDNQYLKKIFFNRLKNIFRVRKNTIKAENNIYNYPLRFVFQLSIISSYLKCYENIAINDDTELIYTKITEVSEQILPVLHELLNAFNKLNKYDKNTISKIDQKQLENIETKYNVLNTLFINKIKDIYNLIINILKKQYNNNENNDVLNMKSFKNNLKKNDILDFRTKFKLRKYFYQKNIKLDSKKIETINHINDDLLPLYKFIFTLLNVIDYTSEYSYKDNNNVINYYYHIKCYLDNLVTEILNSYQYIINDVSLNDNTYHKIDNICNKADKLIKTISEKD